MKSFSGSAAFLSVFTHSLIAPRIREFQPWVPEFADPSGDFGTLGRALQKPGL